jgi:hypothetical protein
MFDFSAAKFRYTPYPIGWAPDVLPADLYNDLASSYPELNQMLKRESLGNKYILTEFDGKPYYDIVSTHPAWRKLYDFIKNPIFVEKLLGFLKEKGIDLGLGGIEIVSDNFFESPLEKNTKRIYRLGKRIFSNHNSHFQLTSRFEFGAFPGSGGSQYPHTDAPRKTVALVLSMAKEDEWSTDWGGGTAVVWPKDEKKTFNYLNDYLGFEEVDVLEEFKFLPNSCVIFVKTFNSWHAVMPIRAPENVIRKSLVINIDLIGMPDWKTDY